MLKATVVFAFAPSIDFLTELRLLPGQAEGENQSKTMKKSRKKIQVSGQRWTMTKNTGTVVLK